MHVVHHTFKCLGKSFFSFVFVCVFPFEYGSVIASPSGINAADSRFLPLYNVVLLDVCF
jgi:hypothetical protein